MTRGTNLIGSFILDGNLKDFFGGVEPSYEDSPFEHPHGDKRENYRPVPLFNIAF